MNGRENLLLLYRIFTVQLTKKFLHFFLATT